MTRLLLLVVTFLSLLPSLPASAGATSAEAERLRLREEMLELASRSAWKGVDRNYAKVLDVNPEPSDHLLGAQAATNLGEILVAVERLERAVAPEPTEAQREDHDKAKAQLDDLLNRYGKVEIAVANGRLPGLIRFELPFGTEERETIQRAREAILKDRAYRGLLPIGSYMIDGEKFEIIATDVWQSYKVE